MKTKRNPSREVEKNRHSIQDEIRRKEKVSFFWGWFFDEGILFLQSISLSFHPPNDLLFISHYFPDSPTKCSELSSSALWRNTCCIAILVCFMKDSLKGGKRDSLYWLIGDRKVIPWLVKWWMRGRFRLNSTRVMWRRYIRFWSSFSSWIFFLLLPNKENIKKIKKIHLELWSSCNFSLSSFQLVSVSVCIGRDDEMNIFGDGISSAEAATKSDLTKERERLNNTKNSLSFKEERRRYFLNSKERREKKNFLSDQAVLM